MNRHSSFSLFFLALLLGLLGTQESRAQSQFIYTNDDVFGANTVSAFSVAPNGVLTPVAGSPFPTGGAGSGGGFFASNRITVCVVGNFLFVGNDGSNNVSAFSINPVTGALTPVPGSPFATNGFSGLGISLAATPDGRFLLAGNAGSRNISVFGIAANGALSPVAGSPFFIGGEPDGMKVSPNGAFLGVALPRLGGGAIAMFSIAFDGSLAPVPGSPFPDGGFGTATSVEFNCAGDLLFAGEANFTSTIVDVFDVAANGSLAAAASSPFVFPSGDNSNVVLLSPDERHLFVSNQFSNGVTSLAVGPGGSLSVVPGSPFPVGGAAFDTSGLATNPAGTQLYTASLPNQVGVFSIAPDGSLTSAPGSPVSTGRPFGLLSLAAFPSRTCGIEAPVDIKPSSCPNPLNPRSRGVLPAAVAGSSDLDATQIDPLSLRLVSFVRSAGTTFQQNVTVAPLRWQLEDVATPFEPLSGKSDCFDDCTAEGPDGRLDLSLKFDTQEVVQAIEAALGRPLADGECLAIGLSGRLFDGTRIAGEDVVILRAGGRGPK